MPPSTSKITVTSTASNGIVAQGMPFSINCSTDGSISPIPVITLTHQRNVTDNATGHQLLHTVSSATNADEGNYTCLVSNRQGKAMKSLPNLIDVQGKHFIYAELEFYVKSYEISSSKC